MSGVGQHNDCHTAHYNASEPTAVLDGHRAFINVGLIQLKLHFSFLSF